MNMEQRNQTQKLEKEYDVIIIGAGLGGLAAGSLIAQKGKSVLVIEKHNLPGGYATNFRRKDFEFDVSLHSFDGVTRGTHSFQVIEACGIADKVEFLSHDSLYQFHRGDIHLNVKHRDLEDYLSQLIQHFPEEKHNLVRLFTEAEKNFRDVSGFLFSRAPFWLRFMLTPFKYRRLLKYESDTVDDFFSRYTHNETLKSVLSAQWSYFGLPAKYLAFGYFSYPFVDYLRNGGYSVKGGSQRLSNALVEVIECHGGAVQLSSPVSRIRLDRKGRACGVESKRTGFIKAHKIITNVSPYAAVAMVGREYFQHRFLNKLGSLKTSVSGFQVYLGLDCSLQELGVQESEYIHFFSPECSQQEQFTDIQRGEVFGDKTGWSINYFSNIDPSLTPAGKSSLGLFTLVGTDNWNDMDKSTYRQKKKRLMDWLIEKASRQIPGLKDHIEICEGGTPRTMAKFTHNPGGAIYGFEQSIDQSGLFRRFPQKYPIKGLYQVGAWTFPGAGFIGTMISAKTLVDRYF